MPDVSYQPVSLQLKSAGISARATDDTMPPGTYLTLQNVEELSENALGGRLGSTLVARNGNAPADFAAAVHSISRLPGFAGAAWRYVGSGTQLWRRTGSAPGPFLLLQNNLSGSPWSAAVYRPFQSSYPYLFIADALRMLKDNGTLTTPQQWGIFQPNKPVLATVLPPSTRLVDPFNSTVYTVANASLSTTNAVNTTLTSASTVGVATVTVANVKNIGLYQRLTVGAEVVTVMAVTANGFAANFAAVHAIGATVTATATMASIAASTTATITKADVVNLGVFDDGTVTDPEDYIAMSLFCDNPSNIQEIRIMLDVSDGTFTSNYFYKVVTASQLQPSVSGQITAAQAVADQVYEQTIGTFTSGPTSPQQLSAGLNVWTQVLTKLGQFVGVGNAAFTDPNYNFSKIVAMRIQIITNSNGSVNIGMNGMIGAGGGGPDSYGGVAYEYLQTYYNAVTGAESNPSMFMSDVNPPTTTNHVLPRRQRVALVLNPSPDSQVTHQRVYRRGGTLSQSFVRIAQVVNGVNYVDDVPDAKASAGAIVSLTNDVPVTSTLPVPVGTTLSVAIAVPQGGGLTVVDVVDATNISVAQQVTIGLDTDDNQETVIVISLVSGGFTAWVQNPHAIGDPVKAESRYGQPCNICVVAFNTMWLAGDVNNPHFLYYSTAFSPESFGAGNQIEVGTPDDPITAIVPFNGTLYVSTRRRWWAISPGTQGGTPTPYPTSVAHGVVAPFAWVEVEKEIWFRSMDGIRSFSGGGATYRTQEIEFVMQGVGTTPVPIADPAQLALTRMAYYNNIVFVSYMALDGAMHRLAYHTIYNRWRNDDVQASAMLWEDDINSLLYGTPQGSLYQDRVGFFDEQSTNPISQRAIPINIISGYMDQGALKFQKNYNEVTIEADTQGQDLAVSILFDDAQASIALGTINTVGRFRKNFPVNNGLGQAAYRAALQITGSVTQKTLVYQAHMNVVQLAAIRRSFDTYDLKFGIDESKILKQMYVEYTAPTAPIIVNVYYDQRATPLVLTLPVAQTRLAMRVRMPAIKFRIFRLVMNSIADFQLWPDSKFEVKPVVATKSYQTFDMVP